MMNRPAGPCEQCGGCARVSLAVTVFLGLFGLVTYLNAVHYLKYDEQLLFETRTEKWVINGPGKRVVNPFYGVSRVRKATLLEQQQYMHIKDLQNGNKRLVHGPGLVFLGAYDVSSGLLSLFRPLATRTSA